MDVTSVALALGSSLTAGLNLYITVLTLGLMDRFGVLELPAQLEVLSHPLVLATGGTLVLVEFVADKIPYLDNTWDALHSFIRIPAGAVLATSAIGDVEPHILWAAALTGGFVSLAAHGAKASTRLAINSTPEPFTNWFVSLVEDLLSLIVLWLVSSHPSLALGLIALLLTGFLSLIYILYRFLKTVFRGGETTVSSY